MADLTSPSVGLDRYTGGTVTGWEHVLQSMQDFFTTRFGERILREWYGSFVPYLLGRNITSSEVLPFFVAFTSAIDQWEPRYKVTVIEVLSVNRQGQIKFYMDGEYRPRGHLGDIRPEGARRLVAQIGAQGAQIEAI